MWVKQLLHDSVGNRSVRCEISERSDDEKHEKYWMEISGAVCSRTSFIDLLFVDRLSRLTNQLARIN